MSSSISFDNNYNLLKKIINSLYLRDKIFSFVKLIHKNHKNVYQSPIQITGLGWYDIGCFPEEMIKYNQKERYKNIFNTVIRDRDYNDDTIAKFKELYLKSTVTAARLGHLDLIEFIHQALPNEFCFKSILYPALEAGHLSILQYIHQYNLSQGLFNSRSLFKPLLRAAELGYLDIVKFIHENKLDTPAGHPLKSAISSGNLDVVKYIHSNFTDTCRGVLDSAISYGFLNIFEFLIQNRPDKISDYWILFASDKGLLPIIRYLIENNVPYLNLPELMLDHATSSGNLELVQYLHENTTVRCTTRAMDYAATNGYFEILKYLHYNRSEGCTVAAMNNGSGHLEIIKFLQYNRSEGCTDEAMYNACIGGHLETAKFLNENRTEGCHSGTKSSVSISGHFEIYRYLHLNRTDQDDYPILDNFAGCDDPTALQWLKENTTNNITIDSYMIAIKNGKLMNFKWIKENTTLPIPFNALDEAAKRGHLDFVEYLHSIGANCSTSAMDETNNLEILKFLHFNRTEGFTHLAYERAIRFNDIHSIKFLHQIKPETFYDLLDHKESQCYGYISRLKLIKELKL
ncbi:hypothetical protein PPL_09884 [Heterostelium album PN500]|uniref:Ankyrin repeat protein n=1 Tax=Heterostelium pallidum (strain ATCC 26659 / Pp 5 / PN500) TaxID=670386 RepID=D3BPB9_HETP5|nr:hypothetical protein PPL_09884 [Heterostelium album PN500]EFA77129.1 hypothetical protein PPL_09884 [Heterostelium album PN500]|eukprot:XP_020429258.1 hypothetical protein PPL_09884 [Heterostelium album PN500]